MRESSDEDLGVREVAGFVMVFGGLRRDDVQGMLLKKVWEDGSVMVLEN
jgi:hypothetical protein